MCQALWLGAGDTSLTSTQPLSLRSPQSLGGETYITQLENYIQCATMRGTYKVLWGARRRETYQPLGSADHRLTPDSIRPSQKQGYCYHLTPVKVNLSPEVLL